MKHLRLSPRFTSLIALLLLALAGADGTDTRELDRLFPRSTLQIATPDARLHTFSIWVADNEARRARGLMFVRSSETTKACSSSIRRCGP